MHPTREKNPDWPAGYVRRDANGARVFMIEREITIEGRRHRFHLSTGCHSLKPALEQLARFEADPFSYNRGGSDLRAALLLTADMIESFYDWQVSNGRTPKYARETSNWLARWVPALRGVDLRRLVIARHVLPTLDAGAAGARRPMIAALKTIMAWLRVERHELTHAEDATADLRLPKYVPAKHHESQIVAADDVRKAAAHLTGPYLDCLVFQVGTAAHVTELERFVRDSRSKLVVFDPPRKLADGAECHGVVMLWHKTKKWHRIPLTSRQTVEAAQRLRVHGAVPKRLNDALYAACDAAGVERFSYKLRHSVLTWARQRGATREAAAEFAGHTDVSTTEIYLDLDLPASAIPVETI